MYRLASCAHRWIRSTVSRNFSLTGTESQVSFYAVSSSVAAAALYSCYPQTSLSEHEAVNSGEYSVQDKTKGPEDAVYRRRTPYTAYTREGIKIGLADVVNAMEDADVVLLGETHDDRIAHLLQLQLLRGAQQQSARMGRPVALSLEMFERDVQGIMDEYLAGIITERDLKQDGRPWPNYDTDYRPLVELAKAEGLPVICANAPRRYVSMAGRHGRASLDGLPAASKQWLPPLPFLQPSQAYLDKTNETMQAAAQQMQTLREEQEGEAASEIPAGNREAEASGSSVSAQNGEEAGACSAPSSPQMSTADSSDERSANHGEGSAAKSSSAGKGCPFIGFTASTNFMDAQTLWDASMAYSISTHILKAERTTDTAVLQRQVSGDAASLQHSDASEESSIASASSIAACESRDGSIVMASRPLVLHVCGKFHSEGGLGISEHLNSYKEGLRLLVVTFLPTSKDVKISPAEFLSGCLDKYGDFVILTDQDTPRFYIIEHPV